MRAAVALVVLAAVLATPALGKRTPTTSEAKAIRVTIASFIAKPNSPAASNNHVVRIRVSTVDLHFSKVDLNSGSAGPSTALLKKKRTGWKVIAFGSADFPCKLAPLRVWLDLFPAGFCVSPDDGAGGDGGGVVPYASAS